MGPKFNLRVVLNLRALLVVASLICLCVSSNVGLQFYPLPAATSQVTLDLQLERANNASHAPRADEESFRVPMMVQSKKRADRQPPQSDPVITLPSDRFELPSETRFASEVGYTVCFSSSVAIAPRAGRAPPSLV